MSEKPNILFIVEGERLEPEVINRMAEVYGLRCDISSVCTNIHILYQQLKQDDGYSDVIPVLQEILRSRLASLETLTPSAELKRKIARTRDDLAKLNHTFASFYLVFDSELHHRSNDSLAPLDVIENNVAELKEMLEFFDNETDQGKLYVNYPMMESYRDCDDFFDASYRDRLVSLDILFGGTPSKGYKSLVASRRLANVRNQHISQEQFNRLTCMNVFKLNWMKNHLWQKPNYDDFLKIAQQESILELEHDSCRSLNAVAVLNTLLFFIIDYKGQVLYENEICP
jgi:hypothetical protein